MKTERGFTLLEMMVVVAIIAILAAILIPNFTRARAQAMTSACMGNIKTIATALELYYTDNQQYPDANGKPVQSLGLSGYLDQTPVDPAASPNGAYTVTTTNASGNGGVAGYQIWCPGTHDPATLTKLNGGTAPTGTTLKYDNQKGFSVVSAPGS